MPRVTTADGVRLVATEEGTGPTLVLIGGFAMAATGWGLQRAAFSADHRVVCIDRRSHGAADHVTRGQRMARHARDVDEVLRAMELTEVVILGASMGANVIWSLVELFGTQRLRAVVTVDQTPKMVNEGDWELGHHDLTPESAEAWVQQFPGDHNPFHRLPPLELLATMRDPSKELPMDDLRPLLRDHTWADWRDVVQRVDVPVLAIAGRHSPVWPCESSEWIADHAPDGRCVVLEDSGHVPFLEQPDEFNAAVRAFLAELA